MTSLQSSGFPRSVLEQKLLVVEQGVQEILSGFTAVSGAVPGEVPLQGLALGVRRETAERGQEELLNDVSVAAAGGEQARYPARGAGNLVLQNLPAHEVEGLAQVRVGVALTLAGHRPGRPAERLQKWMLILPV